MSEFTPGKVISFRLPKATPTRVLTHLDELKKEHGRKFGGIMASRFVQMVDQEINKKHPEEMLVIPLPTGVSEEEKEFLRNEKNQALIGQLIVQLLKEPGKIAELPRDMDTEVQEPKEPEEKPYIQNEALLSFAQKTFLDFDDDDDD